MGESDDRVQEALAAYLDYLELGGPKPDAAHLSSEEQLRLQGLIDALELTEGIAFGRGSRDEITQQTAPSLAAGPDVAHAERTEALVSQLGDALAPRVRVERDTTTLVSRVGGVGIVGRWIVGTFGGRVRVWLMDAGEARALEENRECLTDLNLVFRMFPDTDAVGLVADDLSCLLVQPEDCAPQIEVPTGSLVGRRYRRSIQPVGEAVSAFLDELHPYWDPVPAFDSDAGLHIDVSAIGRELAGDAIERQRGIGTRARKGNPKKEALLALGPKEISAIAKLVNGLIDGTIPSEETEARIERLARNR
jgi:hypothetical protein